MSHAVMVWSRDRNKGSAVECCSIRSIDEMYGKYFVYTKYNNNTFYSQNWTWGTQNPFLASSRNKIYGIFQENLPDIQIAAAPIAI